MRFVHSTLLNLQKNIAFSLFIRRILWYTTHDYTNYEEVCPLSITVFEPVKAVRVVAIPDTAERFKTAQLTVQLLVPLAEETAAANALVPFLLRRACRAFPDFPALKRELDRLYGARLTAAVRRVGEAQALYLQMSCLDDRFALNGEAVAAQCAALLCEMLFQPVLQDGVFRRDDMEEERRCLLETIRAEINNKRGYARTRCTELLCEGEAYAVRASGTEEAVAALTAADVTAAWKRVLRTARVQILYHGNGDGRAVAAPFVDGFCAIERTPCDLTVSRRTTVGARRDSEETMAVAQGKMVLGFVSTADVIDVSANRIAGALFGGTAFSMLFRTVREQLSLCYYCTSSFDRLKGVGMIDSGVEAEKIPVARAEIEHQLALLKAGAFSEEDLENTRRYLVSQYRTVGDLQSSLVGWYDGQALEDTLQTPEEAADALLAVTREQVTAAAATWEIACEFRLLPNGEAEEGGDDGE